MKVKGRGDVGPTDSIQSVATSGFPLGVKCNFCLRRTLLDAKDLTAKYPKPALLSALKFKCTKCKRRDFHIQLFWSRSSVTRFMRADD